MANQNSHVRFDTREIAVIFSLFIFVSLLMFTVGILVGKGLAQARYEGSAAATAPTSSADHEGGEIDRAPTAIDPHGAPADLHHKPEAKASSTSVTTDHPSDAHPAADPHAADSHGKAPETAKAAPAGHGEAELYPNTAAAHGPEHKDDAESTLELVPKKAKTGDVKAGLADFPKSAETESLFKNPKTRDIFEADPKAKKLAAGSGAMVEKDFTKKSSKRGLASVPNKIPQSFPEGKYTVQVGSYSEQKEAADRVESLKKMGFPFAYFSANELKERNEIWYRVYLGFYSDHDSANSSGDVLEARGEVKNFLVRKIAPDSAKN